MDEANEFSEELKKRFAKLPKVVQDAILSADVEKQLRALAETHKLHFDQWENLENEVQMTLLGIKPSGELAENIKTAIGTTDEVASALAADISRAIFEPIREQLERGLGHPDAHVEQTSAVEDVRAQMLNKERGRAGATVSIPSGPPVSPLPSPASLAPAPVAPATPPPVRVQGTAVREPISASYKAGEASSARKSVHDDPYRESPV